MVPYVLRLSNINTTGDVSVFSRIVLTIFDVEKIEKIGKYFAFLS